MIPSFRRNELYFNYHLLVAFIRRPAGSVTSKTLILILFFSLSLYICFNGLFYSASESGGELLVPTIAFVLMSITSAMLFFISTWSNLQILSDDLDKEYLTLRFAVRIYGRIAEDTRKGTNDKTEGTT